MHTYLASSHEIGSGTLVLNTGRAVHFGTPPYKVTVTPYNNVKDSRFINRTLAKVFNVISVSGDTLTVTTSDDYEFAANAWVILGEAREGIKDTVQIPARPVYTTDRFNNPEFIVSLPASKVADLPTSELPGTNTLMYDNALACGTDTSAGADSFVSGSGTAAMGAQSFASGLNTTASSNWCHSEGLGTIAGSAPYTCTIAGPVITIIGMDVTDNFYDGSPLALMGLSGGTGPVAVLGVVRSSPYGVAFSDGNTVITLDAVVTDHTAGKVCMTDLVGTCHAEGENTTASGNAAHAEGYSTIASGGMSHAEGNTTVSSGNNSHAEGERTLASGNNSHAEGYYTIAAGSGSHAGGIRSKATLRGQRSFSGGYFGSTGDSQGSSLHLMGVTTDATPTGLLAGDIDHLAIPTDHTLGFTLRVTARRVDDGTVGARFVRTGLIANNAGTTALIEAAATLGTDVNTSGLAVAVTADDANNALAITVTGLVDTIIRWTCIVDWEEVG